MSHSASRQCCRFEVHGGVRNCGYQLWDHPPYWPDLPPSAYSFFPNMKKHLPGNHFSTNDEVIAAVKEFFEGQDHAVFTTGILKLPL